MRAGWRGASRTRDERAAALVELAIVLPLVIALILGLFTGGMAYNRKITIVNAAREASRYGATLPVSNFPGGMQDWLKAVADAAEKNASGDMDTGTAGRSICVAFVHPAELIDANDRTTMLVRTDAGDTFSSGTCFDDDRPDDNERRVQVELGRQSELQTLIFTWNLNLTATSLSHFEAG